jgi:DNA-binding GntR family transcriptional regulator
MAERSLDDQVHDILLARIARRELCPGEHLVEAEIAEQMGVSRTPVRAALRTLIAEGLVEKRNNRGCIVAKHDLSDICRMFELREAVEGMAARLAALRGETAHVVALWDDCEALERAQREGRPTEFARHDLEFHRCVIRASDNPFIARVANAEAVIARTFSDYPAPLSEPWLMEFAHRAVVEAIEARDPDAAEAAMRRHVREARERLERWIREATDGREEVVYGVRLK